MRWVRERAELHDELGQYLTALRMDVTLLEIRYGQGDPELARKLAIMKQTINTTVNAVRTVMTSLRRASHALEVLLQGLPRTVPGGEIVRYGGAR